MSDPKPVRLQLSRQKGFNLQALSMATNGLPAVNVARPSRWGNPYKVGSDGGLDRCLNAYRKMMENNPVIATELRGKNLACWCKQGWPCHADILLEIANAGEPLTSPASQSARALN